MHILLRNVTWVGMTVLLPNSSQWLCTTHCITQLEYMHSLPRHQPAKAALVYTWYLKVSSRPATS